MLDDNLDRRINSKKFPNVSQFKVLSLPLSPFFISLSPSPASPFSGPSDAGCVVETQSAWMQRLCKQKELLTWFMQICLSCHFLWCQLHNDSWPKGSDDDGGRQEKRETALNVSKPKCQNGGCFVSWKRTEVYSLLSLHLRKCWGSSVLGSSNPQLVKCWVSVNY